MPGTNVIDLEKVVPGLSGTTFKMPDPDGGYKEYHVPGDLPTETVFKMLALFEELVSFEEKSAAQMAKQASSASIAKVRTDLKGVTDRINEELLAIFQLSDPKLELLPFGSQTTAVVLGEVFKALGLAAPAGGELPSPPPNRAARRATARKTTMPSTRKAASPKTRPAKQ